MNINLKESYLINNTYLKVAGRPSCDLEIIAMAAHDIMT